MDSNNNSPDNRIHSALQNKFMANIEKVADNARAFTEQSSFLKGNGNMKRHQS